MLLIHLHILSVNVAAIKRIVKAGQNKCLINHESELTYSRNVGFFSFVTNACEMKRVIRVTHQTDYGSSSALQATTSR